LEWIQKISFGETSCSPCPTPAFWEEERRIKLAVILKRRRRRRRNRKRERQRARERERGRETERERENLMSFSPITVVTVFLIASI
jgi:hypothetical protein